MGKQHRQVLVMCHVSKNLVFIYLLLLTMFIWFIQLSRRELSAQHPKQLQEEERGKLQQKAKANAKLEELNRCLFAQNEMSNDVPLETNKNLCKQNAGSAAKNTAAAISSTQNVMCAAKKTDISMLEHIAQKTEAESHDSNAPKLLQTEDREGQVHK